MSALNHTASRELSHHKSAFVSAFDTLLADVIHDRFHEDEQLRQLAAAFGETEAALTHREDEQGYDDVASTLDEATGQMSHALERRAYERVAELCEFTATEVGSWTDTHNEDDLREAVSEAHTWLSMNTNAAERAGVDYGSALPDVDELFADQEVAADA